MSESELPIGYYLIKSKYAEGHVGICANGTHDRRLVMLTHQNAHGITWFIKEDMNGLLTIQNGSSTAGAENSLVSVFPGNRYAGEWNIVARPKYGPNVYTIINREDDAGWVLPSTQEDIQIECNPLTCHLTDKTTFRAKELWTLVHLPGLY